MKIKLSSEISKLIFLYAAVSMPAFSADDGIAVVTDGDGTNIAIGDKADSRKMNGDNSISIGKSSSIGYGNNSIAVGSSSYVTSSDAIAIGTNSLAGANGTIVIGKNAKSGGGQGVVIGANASQGDWRKHFPTESTASVSSTVAVGDNSSAAGVASVAVGSGASATRDGYGTALGDDAEARGKSSTAVGAQATSVSWGSVALGLSSASDRVAGVSAYMPETRSNNAEEVVISRMDEAQRNRLAEIDKQIAHYKEIVDPLADAYFSLSNELDKRYSELEDSELSGVEYAEKRAEIDKYRTESKLTDKSRAYYGSPEYAALNKLQAERSRIFSAYVSTHGAVSVGNGKSITRQITSVAAGSEDTDAVNVAQLRDLQTVTEKADAALDKRITNNTSAITKNLQVVNSNKEEISNINKTTKILDERVTANTQTAEEHKLLISENSKQISTNALGIRENTQRIRDEGQARIRGDRETLRAATGYTDMRVNGLERNTNKRFAQLKEDIDKNRKRADAGIAGAMAMTGIPSVPGKKVSFGMAMAGYRSEGAVAAGFHFNTSENSAVKVNAAWDSESGVGVSAGMALGW